jgi:hypothetical protein
MGSELQPPALHFANRSWGCFPTNPLPHPEHLERFAAQVVHLSQKSGIDTPHSARIELDLGDGYLALLGYFSGKDEFMEEARERPFGEAT